MTKTLKLISSIAFLVAVLWGCQQKDLITPPEILAESISIEPSSATLEVDDEIQLDIVVEPSGAKVPAITWKSLNEKFVEVDSDGIVTAIAAGNARVRATTADGKLSATCTIKVIEPVIPSVPVTGVSLDITQKELNVGEKFTLTATITPDNADVKDVNWTSSNNSVAKVTNALVEAVGEGSAVITVTTVDGKKTATCSVTVTKPGQGGGGEGGGEEDDPEEPRVRWADTGADVPALPSYNKVTSWQDFPRIDITVSGGITSKTTYKAGTVRFSDPKNMYSKVSDTGELPGQFKGRGNSSWDYAEGGKKPYRIKLDTKSKVFGMGSDRDWILLADSMDPSQMRNEVAQRVARVISMEFAPRFRTVELYINSQYMGSYTLIEHKETGMGHKVMVDPDSGDGYYVELDAKGDDPVQFTSSTFSRLFNFKEPEQPTSTQKTYFQTLINDTESAMKNKNWTKVHELIEMDTWIQNYIVQELAMNVDGNMRLSTYFAKDKDTKLYMPMVWDFDLAFGNATYIKNFIGTKGPEGWWVKVCGGSERDSGHPSSHSGHQTYYQYLFQDPAFVARVKELWTLYYPRLVTVGTTFIDGMAEYNAPAFQHAADQGKNPRVRSYSVDNESFFRTYGDAISYMKNFYNNRLTWLNTNINAL